MRLLGQWSWWAPKPLLWLYERFGISEADSAILPAVADPPDVRHRRGDEHPAVPAASNGAARTAATAIDGG